MFRFAGIVTGCFLALNASAQTENKPPAADKPRLDLLGDPLPEGALARLGTTRLRHGGPILAMAISPDGKILASGGTDETICLWNAATGKELRRLKYQTLVNVNPGFVGQFPVTALAFSGDSKILISGDGMGILRLWDANSGRELRRFGKSHDPRFGPARIVSMTVSADGRTLWTCGNDRIIRQWLAITGLEIRQFQGHQGVVLGMQPTPDGKQLISVDTNGSVRVWDLTQGRETRQFNLQRFFPGDATLAFSKDVKMLAVCDMDFVHLYDVDAGKMQRQIRTTLSGRNVGLAFAPSNKVIAVVQATGGVRLYGITSGQELRYLETPPQNTKAVLIFSPTGTDLACSCGDQSIRLWELASQRDLLPAIAHSSLVQSLCYTADGKHLISAGNDKIVRLWTTSGKSEGRITYKTPIYSPQFHVAPGPDSQSFIVGISDSIRHWEKKDGILREVRLFEGWRPPLTFLAGSSDGKTLAVIGGDPEILLFDTRTGQIKHRLNQVKGPPQPGFPPNARPNVVTFSPDGNLLAVVGYGRPAQIWNVNTGKLVRQLRFDPNRGFPSGQAKLAFSADGKTLAVGEYDIRLYEVATGLDRLLITNLTGGRDNVRSLAFSPDGSLLLAGMLRGGIILYEVTTGFEAGQLTGQSGEIRALAMAPDGRSVASCGADTSILIWDAVSLAKKGRPAPARLQGDELDLLWKLLGDADAGRAYQALWSLVAAAEQSVPYLKGRLKAAEAVDLKRIPRLIADLEDASFNVRTKATRELEKLGDLAEPDLVKTLEQKPSLEVRRRIEQLLGRLQGPSSDKILFLRAMEVLERAGSAEAQKVLAALSQGAPSHWLTDNARLALERLKRWDHPE